jgi:cytochrome c-type biogenesis protein CcmH
MVNSSFHFLAAVMIIFALILIVRPLIQGGLRQKQSWVLFATALTVIASLPGIAIYLYTLLGTPAALDDQYLGMVRGQSNNQLTADSQNSRATQVRQDVTKWLEVAHTYDTERRASDAGDAYEQVLKIDAKNTVAMVGLVEANMAQRPDFSIDASSRHLLEEAIVLEPNNQRALWLLGISEFQQKDYVEASATWRHLQRLLDSGSALARSVAQQIAIADTNGKMKIPIVTRLRQG